MRGGEPVRWYGWHWKAGLWHRLTSGPTLHAAHVALNKVFKKEFPRGVPSTHGALTGGAPPTWRPT